MFMELGPTPRPPLLSYLAEILRIVGGSSKKHEPFLSLVSSRWNREADSRRIVYSRDQSRFSYILLEGGFRNRASSLPRKEAPTDKDRGGSFASVYSK